MKKILSLVLAVALMGAMAVPAAAAESTDARLAAVTQKVKTTLAINTADYDNFYGEVSENELAPTWRLSWSGETGALNVTADEDGRILSYNQSGEKQVDSDNAFGPAFPKLTREEAVKTAQTFLDKVLDKGLETARMEEYVGAGRLSAEAYNLNGTILLNGTQSPLSFRITVRVADNAVSRFDRDGLKGQYIGAVPTATATVTAAKAGETLKGTLSLRLEYVRTDNGETAVLRYLPNSTDEFYVDAQTGKLVNLTELYNKVNVRGGGNVGAAPEAAKSADQSANLTAAEQEGVAKLVGVLDKAALGKKATAITELGLSKYTLAGVAYDVERADEKAEKKTPAADAKVTARLTYARKDNDGGTWWRYVTMDAKGGALLNVSSYTPWQQDAKSTISEKQAQKKAEAFLTKYDGANYGKTALYTQQGATPRPNSRQDSDAYSFCYAQKEGGYFLASNNLNVGVDASDGSISAYYPNFDFAGTFDSAEGIITEQAAIDAYFGTFKLSCAYLSVPEKLDLNAPQWKPLADMGISYLYTLKLGYGLENTAENGWVAGIDAKTGKPVITSGGGERKGITYDDLDGNWVKNAAEKLAQYGVGYLGGSFLPGKTLTQLDAVALLVSTSGYLYDPATEEKNAVDELYNQAYRMGMLKKTQRNETVEMTRGDVVKLLLDGAGYGAVAGLKDIFRCSFADAASIPAEVYGYAALAQGLGIVAGDGAGNFAAGRTATRAEAASMLYQFMSR